MRGVWPCLVRCGLCLSGEIVSWISKRCTDVHLFSFGIHFYVA